MYPRIDRGYKFEVESLTHVKALMPRAAQGPRTRLAARAARGPGAAPGARAPPGDGTMHAIQYTSNIFKNHTLHQYLALPRRAGQTGNSESLWETASHRWLRLLFRRERARTWRARRQRQQSQALSRTAAAPSLPS